MFFIVFTDCRSCKQWRRKVYKFTCSSHRISATYAPYIRIWIVLNPQLKFRSRKVLFFGEPACKIRYNSLCIRFDTSKVPRLNQSRSKIAFKSKL